MENNWLFVLVTALLVMGNLYLLFTSQQGDTLILINKYRTPFWDYFFKIGTKFGEPVAYVGVALIISSVSYRKATFAVMAGLAAGILAALLKLYFAEARPMRWFFDNFEGIWHGLNHFEEEWRSWDETGSFPSGHTSSAFALYGFIAFNARRGKLAITLLCVVLAVMVGFSRMYLLYHFLRDVTAGAALGTVVAIAAYYAQGRFFTDKPRLDEGWWARRSGALPPVDGRVQLPSDG